MRRKSSAETLDDELRALADYDVDRMHASYSLVRIIVWAIPILGFLGTVIGITLAIAKLSPDQLENSLPEVTAGLGIAFDTTALALALSMVLMFAKFFVERLETRLLMAVDRRVAEELVGRFQTYGTGADPHVAADFLAFRKPRLGGVSGAAARSIGAALHFGGGVRLL